MEQIEPRREEAGQGNPGELVALDRARYTVSMADKLAEVALFRREAGGTGQLLL